MAKSLYDQLDQKYPYKAKTKASFRDDTGKPPSFRLDISNPKWKFSLGNAEGNAVEGTFFYNANVFDGKNPLLSKEHPTGADFLVEQKRDPPDVGNPLFLLIKFFAPGSQTNLLGEFLVQDSENVGASSGLLHRRREGVWEFVTDDTLYDQLKKKYNDRKVEGNALFSNNSSFRFGTDELGWEFTCANPGDGLGLDGTLFHNDNVFEGTHPILPKDRPTKADFYVDQKTEHNKRYVLVQFYEPGSQTKKLLGEFLAEDPDDAAGKSGLLHKRKEGEWRFVDTGSLRDQLKKKYTGEVSADALFFKKDSRSSFLFEIYDKSWEFSDGRIVGHRVGGTLFYNEGVFDGANTKLPGGGGGYYVRKKKEKEVLYVHVKFYEPSSQTGKLLFEFLANDLRDTASSSAILYQRRTGTWAPSNYAQATGTASKKSNDTLITLKFPAVHKKAEMHCKKEGEIYVDAFGVPGLLTTTSLSSPGNSVTWYKDRAVFHNDADSENFIGYFFGTDSYATLGSKDDMEWNVTWGTT